METLQRKLLLLAYKSKNSVQVKTHVLHALPNIIKTLNRPCFGAEGIFLLFLLKPESEPLKISHHKCFSTVLSSNQATTTSLANANMSSKGQQQTWAVLVCYHKSQVAISAEIPSSMISLNQRGSDTQGGLWVFFSPQILGMHQTSHHIQSFKSEMITLLKCMAFSWGRIKISVCVGQRLSKLS